MDDRAILRAAQGPGSEGFDRLYTAAQQVREEAAARAGEGMNNPAYAEQVLQAGHQAVDQAVSTNRASVILAGAGFESDVRTRQQEVKGEAQRAHPMPSKQDVQAAQATAERLVREGMNDQQLRKDLVTGAAVVANTLMRNDISDKYFVGAAFSQPGSPTEMVANLTSAARHDATLATNLTKVGELHAQGRQADEQTIKVIASALSKAPPSRGDDGNYPSFENAL